ncbi:MAG: autotransporter outer membrane beta-barrel domain-containing protein [Deltaproteobacteria bacterium]|nr:autotransporter outer membrane beta-barrel domain-containing protein [Deltaproteobacteria bacterium]
MKVFREDSPTDWRERVPPRAVLALAMAFLALALASRATVAAAGQDAELSGSIGHDVYGNGEPTLGYDAPYPGGTISLVLPPIGNAVRAAGDVTVSGGIYGGALSSDFTTVSVEDNLVIADDWTLDGGNIYGGYAGSLYADVTAAGNRVSSEGGGALVASSFIYGGYAFSDGAAKAWENSVAAIGGGATLSGGGFIYGGIAQSSTGDAQADGNRIAAVKGGAVTADWGAILGGSASTGAGDARANGNQVVADDDGAIRAEGGPGRVVGGYAETSGAGDAQADDNRIAAVKGGAVTTLGVLYGGSASTGAGDARANGNQVVADDDGAIRAEGVAGGFAQSSTGDTQADGNRIAAVKDGAVTSDGVVFGGYAYTPTGAGDTRANGNQVVVADDGAIFAGDNVAGGYAFTNGAGDAQADGNRIAAVNGGAVNAKGVLYGGNAYTAAGDARANGNQVVAADDGAIFVGDVVGGYARTYGANAASAADNRVEISGGAIVRSIYGGYAMSTSGVATADNNRAAISGGISGGIYGGRAASGGAASAANNRVEISGGEVTGNIYGGYALSVSGVANASNNRVDISGTPNLTGAILYGGNNSAGNGDVFSDNVLNLKTSGLTAAAGLANFEFLNFYLPASARAGDVILTISGVASLEDPDNSSRTSTVAMASIPGAFGRLNPGDRIVLIDATSLVGLPANDTLTAAQGVTLTHNFLLNVPSGTQLVTTLAGTKASTGSVALSEGFLAGLAFVNMGADLVAGQGTSEAARAARESLSPSMGLATFMTLSGGSSRYNTGSRVDARGLSLLAGLAWGRDIEPGRLTLGAFFEYGEGNFDTYNSFPNAPSLRGDGDARHIGGGLLASADIAQVGPGTLRAEASVRAGRIRVNFRSPDLVDPWGLAAEYDSSSAYYGASLGLGYEWNLTDKTSLDFYGQYFWTRQGGDSVVLSTGDPVDFEDADSSRLHLGTRLSRVFSERVSARVGAAFERELAGAARASVHGHSFKAPSLKGGTGVGELGLAIAPTAGLPLLTLDLSLQGYAGEREGWSGNMAVKLEF